MAFYHRCALADVYAVHPSRDADRTRCWVDVRDRSGACSSAIAPGLHDPTGANTDRYRGCHGRHGCHRHPRLPDESHDDYLGTAAHALEVA